MTTIINLYTVMVKWNMGCFNFKSILNVGIYFETFTNVKLVEIIVIWSNWPYNTLVF